METRLIILIITMLFATAINVANIPKTGTPPTIRSQASIVHEAISNSLVIFGGYSTKFHEDSWSFNLNSLTWERLVLVTSTTPGARTNSFLFTVKSMNYIYLFGGKTERGPVIDMYVFNLQSQTWNSIYVSGDIPNPAFRSSACIFVDESQVEHLYVYGGITKEGYTDKLYKYNISTSIWRGIDATGDIPPKREGGRLISYGIYLYLFGGAELLNKESQTNDNNLYRFDTVTNVWEIVQVRGNKPNPVYLFDIVVHEGCLYLFYGYNTQKRGSLDEIWRIGLYTEEFAWEKLQIDYTDDQASYIPRNSFSLILVKNNVYMFGGYTPNGLRNDLLKLTLPPIDGKVSWQMICKLIDTPVPRLGHAMHALNNNLIMIGGQGDDLKKLIDIWEVDLNTEEWRTIKITNSPPEARSHFSSTVAGNNVVIYGGESSNGLLGDTYLFSYSDRAWVKAEYTSTIQPSPRKGACIALYYKTLFIFGGMTDQGYSDELWALETPSRKLTYIPNIGDNPPPLAYSFCSIVTLDDRDYFIVSLGETTGNTPMSCIYKFDIKTQVWIKEIDDSPQSPFSRSMASGSYMKDRILFVGGQQWGFTCRNEIFQYNLITKEFEMLGELTRGIYAAAVVHYKDKLYIHGGGAAFGSLLRDNVPSADFVVVDDNHYNKFPCSAGTYINGEECTECNEGEFNYQLNSNTCIPCTEGSYVSLKGSSSIICCMLCSEGSFTDKPGSSKCLNCPQDFTCPVGTKTPDQFYKKEWSFTTSQPEVYSGNSEHVSYTTRISQLIIGLVVICILCIIVLYQKAKSLLHHADIFTHVHNYFPGDVMYVRQTVLGGFFTIMFIGASLVLVAAAVISYSDDNIFENKGLVPIIIVEQEYDAIKSDELFINFLFQNYGDQCEIDGKCTSKLSISFDNLHGNISSYKCAKVGYDCEVSISCLNCELRSDGTLALELTETNSYATAIRVNVTVSSSIPDEYSSLDLIFYPSDNTVFMGNDPSVIELQMTPSIFRTDTGRWKDKSTGYHVTLLSLPEVGSTVFSEQYYICRIPFFEGLRVKLSLSKGHTSLVTQRLLKQTPLIMVSAVSGLVVGVMSLSQFLLTKVEKPRLKHRAKNKIKLAKKNVEERGIKLRMVMPSSPARENTSDKSDPPTDDRLHHRKNARPFSDYVDLIPSDSSHSGPNFTKKKYFMNYNYRI